jgi:uncharacterized protein YggE
MDPRKALIAVAGIAGVTVIAIAAIVMSGGSDGSATAGTMPDTRGIAVSGTGTVTIKPDTSFVDVGVQATAQSVEDARTQAADAMNKVIEALKAQGIAEADIQTTSFSIYPQYDYSSTGQQTLRGYTVSNTVSAKLKKDPGTIGDATGKAIDAVAAAAGNVATVNGVRFTVDDQAGAINQAREKAVADARAKAEQLAQLGKVTLGDPITISEDTASPPIIYGDKSLSSAPAPDAATPIQAGQLEVSVSVSVTYAIQ